VRNPIVRKLLHLWPPLWLSRCPGLTILAVGKLGPNLRAARLKLELSQEQVADRSGVHATEVSRIEAGKRDPRVSTVERLAKAVELNPGQLLE
jgi:DNA-binding XRE family transcriptional regulator